MSDCQSVTVETSEQIVVVEQVGARGLQGPPGSGGDANYVFNQSSPASTWTITHPLNKFPSVSIVDSSGRLVYGIVNYDSTSQVTVDFNGRSFSGKAYLN